MNRNDIKIKLIDLCSEIFHEANVDKDIIEYVDFADDLGMDSITFITLIVELEATFGITVPDDLLLRDYFKNVDSVVQIISDQLVEKVSELEDTHDDET